MSADKQKSAPATDGGLTTTPGPWRVVNMAETFGEVHARSEYGALLVVGEPGDICNVFDNYAPVAVSHEAQANARLIAAAPELLAFARWAIEQFRGESGTGESHWEQYPEYLAGCRAVVKARKGGAS